ncbi:MAG: large-conductance mechanosensitive channel protein MscL [Gammaproteobacteria bacterium]|nr:large-conductance mechanosensitive channel protein MscL [Gammaproteobacteria bacterium]
MFKEFKDFIMKGNVLELAVAVLIAGAFGSVVTSFTNDVIMPIVGYFTGGMDFADMKVVLQEAVGEDTPEVAIMYGKWINTIINFVIVAFILFLIIKSYNNMNKKEEAEAPPAGPSETDLLAEIRDLLKK